MGICHDCPNYARVIHFYMWPILQNIYFSFTAWDAFGSYEWIGLENYKKMFTDQDLGKAFQNTFIYIVLTVPISIFLSIILAVLLNQNIKGKSCIEHYIFTCYYNACCNRDGMEMDL